jgi:alpha-glucoside transport system substrate-binding protein
MRTRSSLTASATLGAVAVLTAGCLSEGGGGGGGGNENTSSTIELMYGFTGQQSDDFIAVVEPWAEQNDITINFAPTQDFNSLIVTRVQGNQLPDIAIFPQPGIMKSIAERDVLADLSDVLDLDDLEANMVPGLLESGQGDDGTQYAVLMSSNIKNPVYYPLAEGEAAGLDEPPQTQEELLALTEQVAGTGTTPWCFGIESGPGTGWPATDWVESLMLINHGEDVYDQWVNHEIPFNDDRVLEVLNQMEELLLVEGRVSGGRGAVAANNFGTAGNVMFDDPPGCLMYRQGNFLAQPGFFPDEIVANLDTEVGVFPLPGADPESKPVLGGGDMASLFSADNEAAQQVMEYLTSTEFQDAMIAQSESYLAPRSDADVSAYDSEISRTFAAIQNEATVWRFDGSDQMPGEVGTGTFWREMVAWISGDQDAQTTLDNIENSWPA